MKIISKTPKKVIIQTSADKIKEKGFDFVWDEIRAEFSSENYDLNQIDREIDEDEIFFELIYKEKSIFDRIKKIKITI